MPNTTDHDDGLEAEETVTVTVRPVTSSASRGGGSHSWIGLFLFCIGIACGVPAALFLPTFLADYGTAVLSIVLGAMLFATVLMVIIFIFREPIWHYLFRRTEIQVSQFAAPLADVARHAAEKKVPEATEAARIFAELALSRYAWVTARRWLVASITGLIAAIAALAGSALLFEQNKLIRQQSVLLIEQNQRIDQQNEMIDVQIQLAEADRSASIVPELLSIGEALGSETSRVIADGRPAPLVFLDELSPALSNRIIAATLAARPYRYLRSSALDPRDSETVALSALSRRTDLPRVVERLAGKTFQATGRSQLIDRDLSPERGQIISMLVNSGIHETEALSFRGADLSYADVRLPIVAAVSFRHANLDFSDFSWSRIRESQFRGGWLRHARFRNAVVDRCDFSAIPRDELKPPFSGANAPDAWKTQIAGADFTGAIVDRSDFSAVEGVGMNFDNAVVARSRFANGGIDGSTFRGAILIDNDFSGAGLKSVDFDGAIVFQADFLDILAAAAAEGTFVQSRFTLDPINPDEVGRHPGIVEMANHVPAELYEARQAWRVRRVAAFE